VRAVPLYLPMVLETPSEDEDGRVFMGGINMYLQQKSSIFSHLPRWLSRSLDSPRLLRWISARADMTDPSGLGKMTLSILRGEEGRQAHELDLLVKWMTGEERPDVICLSNVLLVGMARRLKKDVGSALICTLQGEAPFLDALPPRFREQAWNVLADRVADIDAFVPVSHDYGALMRERLGLDESRVHVVHNGIELDGLARLAPRERATRPTIGYLARMCPEKGLHTLIEAFRILRTRDLVPGVRLRIAGAQLRDDRSYVQDQRERLREHGLLEDVEFLPNIDREQKLEFLSSLSVLSVPATYGESFGLYVIEALAAGVPVVQPRHGAFPELVEDTGGGLLCAPDDPESLAEGLASLLNDEREARARGERGRDAVMDRFTSEHMARQVEKVCMMVAP
jgi:glycosyltransferase involved in cell wall biosynthesis